MSHSSVQLRVSQVIAVLILSGLFYLTHTVMGAIYLLIGAGLGLVGVWIDEKYKVVHSLFFILVLIPLSIFVASSTGNTIGQGLVSALMIALSLEMIVVLRTSQRFDQHFPSGGKPLTAQEITYGVILVSVLALVVSAITIV